MAPIALIGMRGVQYLSVMMLAGGSFFLLTHPQHVEALSKEAVRTLRRAFIASALALMLATVAAFELQLMIITNAPSDAFNLNVVGEAFQQMNFAKSALVRAAAASIVLAGLLATNFRTGCWIALLLGTVVALSFAWMGHGASTDGTFGLAHLGADILHIFAATGWLGALASLSITSSLAKSRVEQIAVRQSLEAFAPWGLTYSATLLLSGGANAAFLVGWPSRMFLMGSYGRLLDAKMVLFVAMLSLAALNRYWLLPRAGTFDWQCNQSAVRTALVSELAYGILVIAAVSWMGILSPTAMDM